MIKNITVTDAEGKIYEATWPKRARGLVKSGRARFVNENTICLACPPNIAEGDTMEFENTGTVDTQEAECFVKDAAKTGTGNTQPDLNYVTEQIDKISKDSGYLYDCLQRLQTADEAAAHAIANIVAAREATNQRMLDLLQEIVRTLNPGPVNPEVQKLNSLKELLSDSGLEENHKFDILNQAVQKLF